jgi:hypothetical protein
MRYLHLQKFYIEERESKTRTSFHFDEFLNELMFFNLLYLKNKISTCSWEESINESRQSDPDLDLARVQRMISVSNRVSNHQANGVMDVLLR